MAEPMDYDRAVLAWRDPDLPRGARWAVVLTWLQTQDLDVIIGNVAEMAGITEHDWERADRWLRGEPPFPNMARS
jgi:hypothetical protein